MVARDKRADGLHGDVDRQHTNVIPIDGNVRRRRLSHSPDHNGARAFLHEVRWVPQRRRPGVVACNHDCMTKNLTVRLPDELAADAEALARAEGQSVNETVKQALAEAVERRRKDPEFRARLRRIIEEDRELLERLAK
jgi:predicted transcriptional regulator